MNKKKRKKTTGIHMSCFIITLILCLVHLSLSHQPLSRDTYIGIIFASLLCSLFLKKPYKAKRLKKIDAMSGEEFETYIMQYFANKGYKASTTATTGDFGADVILKKNGKTTIIQAKRYKGSVGIAAVQEVIGAVGYYKAHSGMVITNSYFTKAAKELASRNNITLWDRDMVAKHMTK